MRSKTSCFNSAVFKKNLTRFSPLWGLYTLCLTLGMVMTYQAGGTEKKFHFVENLSYIMQVMTIVNLVYAPLVAQVLFGDLYSTRMCNAIHAMPLRREGLLVTNVLSGLLFSLIPTLIMTLLALPMAADSYFVDGWKMPLYLFAASNLYFVCYFGMAVFSTFCAGNRLGMALIYALLNFGAFLIYCLISNIYTPMLYGVMPSVSLVRILTPAYYFTDNPLVEPERIYQIRQIFGDDRRNWVATYQLTQAWKTLLRWAGVGAGLTAVSLPLYRKRDLECAGDTLAFRFLEPIFQILAALMGACAMMVATEIFMGYSSGNIYPFLLAGLIIGWFASRMLIERCAKVFSLKNWLKLGGLAAVLAVSLVLTYFDVLGIETWQPKISELESISVQCGNSVTLTEEADFRRVLAIQEEALRDRLDDSGAYGKTINGDYARVVDTNDALFEKAPTEMEDIRYAFDVYLDFTMKSGKVVSRRYVLWADGESGDTARELMSSWERCISLDYEGKYLLGEILRNPTYLYVEGNDTAMKNPDPALVEGLVAAIRQDCGEYTMAQHSYLHHGYFERTASEIEGDGYKTKDLYIGIDGNNGEQHWYVNIFPDSTHTLEYLRQHNLLNWEVRTEDIYY